VAALPPSPFLYPVLDLDVLGGRDPVGVVWTLAEAGVHIVQLRVKEGTDRRRYDAAMRLREATREARMALVINDRADLVRIADADGLHVGQDDLPPEAARALIGPDRLLGVSTHTLAQLQGARDARPDYVAVGPIFPTRTKRDPDPVVGPGLVRRARAETALPLVAIGGITRRNAREVVAAGANGLAVIADLFGAPDLREAALEFRRVLAGE
jgi:thiamine-phosphate pyrophosphorylase